MEVKHVPKTNYKCCNDITKETWELPYPCLTCLDHLRVDYPNIVCLKILQKVHDLRQDEYIAQIA